MIYESENLKNKRAIYEKRDKWLIRLAFLFWAVLLFIYINIVIPYVKSTIGFLGIIVGGIAVITIVYFFIMFFILMRRGRQFRKMNNDIVKEYQETKNGELFLEKLLAIDTKPKDMNDEMTITVIAAGYGDDVSVAGEDEDVIPIDNPLIDNPNDKKDTSDDDLDEILRMLEK